jgi:hypothetical protein
MSELFPAKSIAVEVVSCTDPAREGDFNYWQDKVRIPFLRQAPGIVDVYRYRDLLPDLGDVGKRFMAAAGDTTRYLTLYRINDVDPWALMQRVKEDEQKNGGLLDCAEISDLTVWDFVAHRRTVSLLHGPETRLPDGMPKVILLVYAGMDPARKTEHDDWWLYTHAHDLLETPGLVQCSRYLSLNPEPLEREANLLNIYEIDADDPRAVLLSILEDDRAIRRVEGRFSSYSRKTDPHGSGLYRHWDLM